MLLLARLLSRFALVGIVLLTAFSTPLLLALLRFALLLTLLRIRLALRRRLLAVLVAAVALWATLLSILRFRGASAIILLGRCISAGLSLLARGGVLPLAGIASLIAFAVRRAAAVLALLIRGSVAGLRFAIAAVVFVRLGVVRRCRWRLTGRSARIDRERIPFGDRDVGGIRPRVLRDPAILEHLAGPRSERGRNQRGRATERLPSTNEQFLTGSLRTRSEPRLHRDTREAKVRIDRPQPHGHRRVGRHPNHLLGGLLDRNLGRQVRQHLDPVLHLVDHRRLPLRERRRLWLE